MFTLKCDCCGKSDIPVHVACSSLGAISFAYCYVCGAIGAEPTGMAKHMIQEKLLEPDFESIYYDSTNDIYRDLKDNPVEIKTERGTSFKTRQEYVNKVINKMDEKLTYKELVNRAISAGFTKGEIWQALRHTHLDVYSLNKSIEDSSKSPTDEEIKRIDALIEPTLGTDFALKRRTHREWQEKQRKKAEGYSAYLICIEYIKSGPKDRLEKLKILIEKRISELEDL
jgi:hypothetical protein